MKNKEYVASQLDNIVEALNNIKNAVLESEEEETENVEEIDIPIGETFEFEGKEYVAKAISNVKYSRISVSGQFIESICDICDINKIDNRPCDRLCCSFLERRDKTDVYFVENKLKVL